MYIEIEDYYSLYYLTIEDESVTDKFSFHTPYPLGHGIFEESSTLELVEQEENLDSEFRFGRGLKEDEKLVYNEKFVLAGFDKALNKFNSLYS